MSLTVLLPAAMSVVAMMVIAFALRGRKVDEHPICRRCGFDLFGKPQTSVVCGECGADLNRRRAVRIGRREKRRGLFWLAFPILLASVGWEGLAGWQAARPTDFNRHVPVWWLMHNVRGKNTPKRDAALAELARRVSDGTLESQRESALIAEAMKLQADLTRPWTPGWGTLVESAHDAGRLPEDQWRRYLLQGFGLTLTPVRSVYRVSDRISFDLRRGPDRYGAMKDGPLWFHVGIYMPMQISRFGIGDIAIDGHRTDCFDETSWDRELMILPDVQGVLARAIADEYEIVPGGVVGRSLGAGLHCKWPKERNDEDDPPGGTKTARLTLILNPLWPGPTASGDRGERSPSSPAWRQVDICCSFELEGPPVTPDQSPVGTIVDAGEDQSSRP